MRCCSSRMSSYFAGNLRLLREGRGWTQVELARRAGSSPAAISHFETRRRMPSLPCFCCLVNAFDTEADVFLTPLRTVGKKKGV